MEIDAQTSHETEMCLVSCLVTPENQDKDGKETMQEWAEGVKMKVTEGRYRR